MNKRKHLERKYGKLASSMQPYYDHLDLRPVSDLDDDAFSFIMSSVRGVNMLDLNETAIGNRSISLLVGLEYVKELRAKECRQLDNNCSEDLNNINGLELLHVKDTRITIDGLLKLTSSPHLKTLLFSADDVRSIKGKLLQLKEILPGCEFVINSKPYLFHEHE